MSPMMEIVLPAPASANVPAFLAKLWKLVDDPDTNSMISWSPEGTSFVIHNQAEFTQSLLPYYYKHSNMASFVRQLNMYGFHKVVGVDSGGLKSEKQEEMEFAHPCFLRGMEHLLEKIKRKVASQAKSAQFAPAMKSEKVNEVLNEVKELKDKQEDLDGKLETMKKENEALWREVVTLRRKHENQQKIVNKLIQFLVGMVQPRMGPTPVKRRYQAPLALETADVSGLGGSSSAKEAKMMQPTAGDIFIQDVTHEMPAASSTSSATIELPLTPQSRDALSSSSPQPAKTSNSAASAAAAATAAAAMQPVDPSLVNPAISGFLVPTVSAADANNSSSTSKPAGSGKVATLTPPTRPTLMREVSREDVDMDVTGMQKELENLKDLMSGQITIEPSIISSLFNPEEPMAPNIFDTPVTLDLANFSGASGAAAAAISPSSTNLLTQPQGNQPKLRLELANAAASGADEAPTLFELADIDDDGVEAGPNPSRQQVTTAATTAASSSLPTDSINTPLIFADQQSPFLK